MHQNFFRPSCSCMFVNIWADENLVHTCQRLKDSQRVRARSLSVKINSARSEKMLAGIKNERVMGRLLHVAEDIRDKFVEAAIFFGRE